MKIKLLILGGLMLLLVAVVAACQPAPAPTAAPVETTPCPTAAPCPSCPSCPTPEAPVVKEVPYQDLWANSPHNTADAEPFNHWNGETPPEVPVDCAKCHTTQGYQEFVANGEVANPIPAPAGTIQCVACHNQAAANLTSVSFPGKVVPAEGGEPQNVVLTDLGPEARCMVCHQGRAGKSTVDDALAKFNATENLDTVPAASGDSTLGFINIHYFPAAATLYGSEVHGGYEYDGKSYDIKNMHVAGYDTCVGCHDTHSLQPKIEECKTCHANVGTIDDVKDIRMAGSAEDYNGNGNVNEGISAEVEGVQAIEYQAIQTYAKEVAGTPIVYSAENYPYFFVDTNGDGQASEDETTAANGYKSWTGRLLKAAYNYQMSVKDPGAFVHNPKYVIELLYDSTEDLNSKLSTPIDMSAMARTDSGHFAGSEEAFRHWDSEGMIPADCVKCHSAGGLPEFLANNGNLILTGSGTLVVSGVVEQPVSNGLQCTTCHSDLTTFARYEVSQVKFPSGQTLTFGEKVDANLCLNCHQGRESTLSVNAVIQNSGAGNDEVSDKLRVKNPHYFAAGSTLFGNEAMGAYQYDGKKYNGRNMHVQGFQTCTDCHDKHALTVQTDKCSTCHPVVQGPEDVTKIRMSTVDFNKNGDTTEGLAAEVQSFQDALYAGIQKYVTGHGLPAIIYDGASYPYFYEDTNGNGQIDQGEAAYANWTPRLLRATYNYLWAAKDPGAFAHNGQYIMQVLYDSTQDIGGDVANLTRPEVQAPPAQ